MIDLRQIRYFKGVVEAGSFTKAADRLHVAQSALSLHVRRMEDDLGVQLLNREPYGVRATAAGMRLLEHANVILEQLAAAERDLRADRGLPSGCVSIGVPSGAARVLVPPLLSAGKTALPRVSLKIVEAMTGHLESWLLDRRIDLAVLYRRPSDISAKDEIIHESFYLIGSVRLGTAREETVRLCDIKDLPLVLPSGEHSTHRSIAEEAARQGWRLRVEFELDSLASILAMVTDQEIYTVLTPAAFLTEWRTGKVHARRIVEPEVHRSVVLTANPAAPPSSARDAADRLVRIVARELSAGSEWPGRLTEDLYDQPQDGQGNVIGS